MLAQFHQEQGLWNTRPLGGRTSRDVALLIASDRGKEMDRFKAMFFAEGVVLARVNSNDDWLDEVRTGRRTSLLRLQRRQQVAHIVHRHDESVV